MMALEFRSTIIQGVKMQSHRRMLKASLAVFSSGADGRRRLSSEEVFEEGMQSLPVLFHCGPHHNFAGSTIGVLSRILFYLCCTT